MNKHEAIRETHNTVVTIRGNDQSNIVAFDDSGNSVTIDWTKVNNHITSNEYKEKRQAEYPELKEQLDKLYHDINNDTLTTNGEFFKALNSVKIKYPKE
jgi:uncharacterized protein YpuA (DUF1002 family)